MPKYIMPKGAMSRGEVAAKMELIKMPSTTTTTLFEIFFEVLSFSLFEIANLSLN